MSVFWVAITIIKHITDACLAAHASTTIAIDCGAAACIRVTGRAQPAW